MGMDVEWFSTEYMAQLYAREKELDGHKVSVSTDGRNWSVVVQTLKEDENADTN